jgi:hypothetical protein
VQCGPCQSPAFVWSRNRPATRGPNGWDPGWQHRPDGKEGTLSAQRVGRMGSESFSACTRETGTLSDSRTRPLKRRACSSTRKDGASMARHGPSQVRSVMLSPDDARNAARTLDVMSMSSCARAHESARAHSGAVRHLGSETLQCGAGLMEDRGVAFDEGIKALNGSLPCPLLSRLAP